MNDNEVHLIFPDAQQKREFMNQLSDGWGENYVELEWPWEHYWMIERKNHHDQWEGSDGGFRYHDKHQADSRIQLLQRWNPGMCFRLVEVAPLFDDQLSFEVTLIKNEFYRHAWHIEELVQDGWQEIPDKSWSTRSMAIGALMEYKAANDPTSVKFRIKEDHEYE